MDDVLFDKLIMGTKEAKDILAKTAPSRKFTINEPDPKKSTIDLISHKMSLPSFSISV